MQGQPSRGLQTRKALDAGEITAGHGWQRHGGPHAELCAACRSSQSRQQTWWGPCAAEQHVSPRQLEHPLCPSSRVASLSHQSPVKHLCPLQEQSVTAADLVGDPAPQNSMSAIGNLFTRGPGAEQRRCGLPAMPCGHRASARSQLSPAQPLWQSCCCTAQLSQALGMHAFALGAGSLPPACEQMALKCRTDAFVLGERGALLHHLDQPAVIPHVAQQDGRRLPLEVSCLLDVLVLLWARSAHSRGRHCARDSRIHMEQDTRHPCSHDELAASS